MRRMALVLLLAASCASSPPPPPPVLPPAPVTAAEPVGPPVQATPPVVQPAAVVAAEPVAAAVADAVEPPVKPAAPQPRKRAKRAAPAPVVAAAPAVLPRPTPTPPPPSPPAPAAAPPALPVYNGPLPCKLALRGDSPVARACSTGGIKAAKSTMKDLVRQARDNGVKLACDDCHQSEDDYTRLTPEAKSKFAKLLAATR
jgi:hypothetical protein